MDAVRHVVQFSGGAGSWMAAKRVVERYGPDHVTLLTADTRSEHPDWRPFVDAAAAALACELVVLDGGMDIWDLADSQGMIPSPKAAICSRMLKREPMDRWKNENCDPDHTILYFGFDWSEEHRLHRVRERLAPWRCEAPLCWKPLLDKADIILELSASDLPFPTAYRLGLPHNNCLAYGCVKGGQAYWNAIRTELPDVYAAAETREEAFRDRVGDFAILRDRRGGETKPLSLREFRVRLEVQPSLFDPADTGPCDCY